jgi:hypothetical protein
MRGAQAGVKATGSERAGGESILNGTGASSSFVVITVEADNVTIDGFKIEIRDACPRRDQQHAPEALCPLPATAVRSNITLRNNWVYADLPFAHEIEIDGIVFGEAHKQSSTSFSAQIAKCDDRKQQLHRPHNDK